MGKYFFDQYTILHFAVGIIAYFWNVSLLNTVVLHTIFEIIENTEHGMYFINTKIKIWPGGKPQSDTLINSVGDTVGIIAGWILAQMVDKYSDEHHLYI